MLSYIRGRFSHFETASKHTKEMQFIHETFVSFVVQDLVSSNSSLPINHRRISEVPAPIS
jgi:hypothetical protein